MRKILQGLAVMLMLASVPAYAKAQSPTQTRDGYTTIDFKSDLMSAKAPFNVILPVGYEQSVRRYSVLLLLHGLTGHYSDWVLNTNVVLYARKYPLIIVMPEDGNGWYTNGVASNDKWEDYIFKEVIPYVNSHYRTLPETRSWAVAGLSMGGYGAMKFGLKYPGQFAVAASMSGALGAPEWTDSEMGTWQAVPLSLHAAFGAEGAPAHAANSLPVLLDQAKGALPFLYLDCGTEDGLLATNRKFADLLQSKKIPHEYRERPGVHDWIEWDSQVQGVLALIAEKMRLSWCDDGGLCAPGGPAAPGPFPAMMRITTMGTGTPPPPPQP
ncbi:MAG: alpha/beta hydrolase family protein [Candidatus Acidiferrales bacterium]